MKHKQYRAMALLISLALLAGCVSNNVDKAGFDNVATPAPAPQTSSVETNVVKPSATSTLAGTKWVSTSNNLHAIEFGADNSVSGIAGCNVYNGFYGEAGLGLNFTSIAITKNICAESIMTKASVFTDLLQKTSNFQMLSDTIILKDNKDATLLVMKKENL